MTPALREYSLEEVRAFMDQDVDLQSVMTVKKAAEKFGYTLDNATVAEMAAHKIEGIEDALRSFDLQGVRVLLSQDVHLPVAVAVLNNTHQFGYQPSIHQIAAISKNVHNVDDFSTALRSLPLGQVEKLFTLGISYQDFSTVRDALRKFGYQSDFLPVLDLAQKLSPHHEHGALESGLSLFALSDIEKILDRGAVLSGVIEVQNVLVEKAIASTLDESIQFSKLAGEWSKGWNTQHVIEAFGIEQVRNMAAKGVVFPNAIAVKNAVKQRNLTQFDNVETIIAIAKHGNNVEVALKTLEAGFSVEDITRFPFLISPLIPKK